MYLNIILLLISLNSNLNNTFNSTYKIKIEFKNTLCECCFINTKMSLPIAIHNSNNINSSSNVHTAPESPSFHLPFAPNINFSPAPPPMIITHSNTTYNNLQQINTKKVRERVEKWNEKHKPRDNRTISPMHIRINLWDHQQSDGPFTVFVHGTGNIKSS